MNLRWSEFLGGCYWRQNLCWSSIRWRLLYPAALCIFKFSCLVQTRWSWLSPVKGNLTANGFGLVTGFRLPIASRKKLRCMKIDYNLELQCHGLSAMILDNKVESWCKMELGTPSMRFPFVKEMRISDGNFSCWSMQRLNVLARPPEMAVVQHWILIESPAKGWPVDCPPLGIVYCWQLDKGSLVSHLHVDALGSGVGLLGGQITKYFLSLVLLQSGRRGGGLSFCGRLYLIFISSTPCSRVMLLHQIYFRTMLLMDGPFGELHAEFGLSLLGHYKDSNMGRNWSS